MLVRKANFEKKKCEQNIKSQEIKKNKEDCSKKSTILKKIAIFANLILIFKIFTSSLNQFFF